MNRKISLKDVLYTKGTVRTSIIEKLRDENVDIFIVPGVYEVSDDIWAYPDVAIVRNKQSVIEDLEREADNFIHVLFYLGFNGRRFGGSYHEECCSTSRLFIDNQVRKNFTTKSEHKGKNNILKVNTDCSYLFFRGRGYQLSGPARECINLLVTNWEKGIYDMPAADIIRELNCDGHVKKLFRERSSQKLYNEIISHPRHGYYKLNITQLEKISTNEVCIPNSAQNLPTLVQ